MISRLKLKRYLTVSFFLFMLLTTFRFEGNIIVIIFKSMIWFVVLIFLSVLLYIFLDTVIDGLIKMYKDLRKAYFDKRYKKTESNAKVGLKDRIVALNQANLNKKRFFYSTLREARKDPLFAFIYISFIIGVVLIVLLFI